MKGLRTKNGFSNYVRKVRTMTQNLNLNQKLTCNGTGRYQNEYKKSNKICRVFRQGAMQKHAGYWPKNQKSEEDVARLESRAVCEYSCLENGSQSILLL